MPTKAIISILSVFLRGGAAVILIWREGAATPTVPAGPFPTVVPDDRSAADLVANTTSLALRGELQTLYQVKRGDTLLGISRKFGVSVQAIKDANKDKHNILKVDQWLAIPKPK